MKMDAIAPTLFFTEEPLSETLIGEEYSVIPVYVIDVLDPSAEALLSVRMPSGGYAKTADGIELKDVSAAESWSFVSTEYGKYKCTYSYKDATGNSNKSSYDVNVLDNVKPIITTDKEVIRGKVGQKLEIPVYTVSDNYSEAEEIVVAIQIIDTKYEISTLPKSGYIPTKAGVYTISYMAIDKNSNLGFAEVLCVVS